MLVPLILLATVLLAAALGSRAVSLQSPLAPVFNAPAQTAMPEPPGGSGGVERPGRMFDDMPVDPPVHEPGTGTPRYAGK